MLGIEGQDLPVDLLGLCQAARPVMFERFKGHALNKRRLLPAHASAH
jgi:hypothetical protein